MIKISVGFYACDGSGNYFHADVVFMGGNTFIINKSSDESNNVEDDYVKYIKHDLELESSHHSHDNNNNNHLNELKQNINTANAPPPNYTHQINRNNLKNSIAGHLKEALFHESNNVDVDETIIIDETENINVEEDYVKYIKHDLELELKPNNNHLNELSNASPPSIDSDEDEKHNTQNITMNNIKNIGKHLNEALSHDSMVTVFDDKMVLNVVNNLLLKGTSKKITKSMFKYRDLKYKMIINSKLTTPLDIVFDEDGKTLTIVPDGCTKKLGFNYFAAKELAKEAKEKSNGKYNNNHLNELVYKGYEIRLAASNKSAILSIKRMNNFFCKLLIFAVVQYVNDDGWTEDEMEKWHSINKNCIFYSRFIGYNTTPSLVPQYNTVSGEKIALKGNASYCTKKMYSTAHGQGSVHINIDKFAGNMQINAIIANKHEQKIINIDDCGNIYIDDTYFKTLVPRKNAFIDSNSTIKITFMTYNYCLFHPNL